ncbi:Decarboxylase tropJ [Psilocybe cubensis]|uniref:Decarboxylase tropJ n=1 Tax=Psilocybe cubensis TaxID=181762 RepID=A0ACB8GXQ7_PSICU|nr:Decarboxylase tropJ [Psilocybe cubensis]KAH9480162.1 Decarboxylase tropJ [Psilocybe cubensis]
MRGRYAIENATALRLTFNSSVTGDAIPSSFLERFIHSQIYAAFPNATSVIHSHTRAVLPFGVSHTGLHAQMGTAAGALGALTPNGTPIFDTAALPESVLPADAPHDLLIRDVQLGDALAGSFKQGSNVVLMRGHGMAVMSAQSEQAGVRDAVFRAFYGMQSAVVQMQALLLGLAGGGGGGPGAGVHMDMGLSAREAVDAAATNEGASLLGRAWDLWVAQVEGVSLYTNDLRAAATA